MVQASHESASAVDVDVYIKKSGGSDVEISHAELNKNFQNMIVETLAMEASDELKVKAQTADEITGVVSYAQLDRSQENG